jgi:ceramide glucosyltransferase
LGALVATHVVSLIVLVLRTHLRSAPSAHPRPPVTILRPACGIENHIEETLASAYGIDYPDYELVFCVADPSDPVVPVIERLIAEHPGVPSRLMTGDDRISNNPKLNNLVKGWGAARHALVVMTDSNVLMPADYLEQLVQRMRAGVGLVSSAPTGIRPDGAAAELECAFLNTYQARWQLTADAFGNGYAQGKTLFWRRRDLDNAGGIHALTTATAEDIASSLLMRSLGLKVRLVNGLSRQPLGRRDLKQVWHRQVRWAQLRRKDLPRVFWFEPLSFNLLLFALAAAAYATGGIPAAAAFGIVAACYAVEFVLAGLMGWPVSVLSLPTWIARDALLPLVWLRAVFTNRYEWRGNTVGIRSMEWTPAEARSPAESLADG